MTRLPEERFVAMPMVLWPEPGDSPVASQSCGLPSTSGPGTGAVTPPEPDVDSGETLTTPAPMTPCVGEAQREWGWTIATYLYLAGLGSGAFVGAVVMDWLGFHLETGPTRLAGTWWWDWPRVFTMWGPAATAIGAAFVLLHLGRNRRRFITAWRNWRNAWMARGFVIVGLFVAVGTAIAGITIFAPEWPRQAPVLWRLSQLSAVVLALGTAGYTGVLLWSKKYVPAWATPVVPALFVTTALSSGLAGQSLSVWIYDGVADGPVAAEAVLRVLQQVISVLVLLSGGLLVLYVRTLIGQGPAASASIDLLLRGTQRTSFWSGIVVGSLVLPLALAAVDLAMGGAVVSLIGAISVLVGTYVMRLVILRVGVRESPPLYRLSVWRAGHPGPVEELSRVRVLPR